MCCSTNGWLTMFSMVLTTRYMNEFSRAVSSSHRKVNPSAWSLDENLETLDRTERSHSLALWGPCRDQFPGPLIRQSLPFRLRRTQGYSWLGATWVDLNQNKTALWTLIFTSYLIALDIPSIIMTRLLNILVLLGLTGSFVAGQRYDQEKQHADADCNVGLLVNQYELLF
jgi:hypothetical protein